MKRWENRSAEEANLLNPAFLSIIAYQCVKGYEDEGGEKAPYVLPFLVTSLILHKKTRLALPKKVNTTFPTWISQPEGTFLKAGYAQRTNAIVPYVKEALIFSFSHDFLKLNANKFTLSYNQNVTLSLKDGRFSQEVSECFQKSLFCGRWLARGGRVETIMALLGVKP